MPSGGHVFISHSSDNREQANELSAFFEARGARVWIAPRDVRPGMDYSEQLQLAIEGCVAFVVLVTDMANKSPYVRAETEMAFSTHKPIFPVRMSDIQPAAGLALFLKIRHWTDAYGPQRESNLERLAGELRMLSGAPADAAPVPPAPPPPPPPAAAPPQPAMAAAGPATVPPADSREEDRWRSAIGPNADWYLERWRQIDAKGSPINWNWAACLLSVFWFAYRKMWLPMFALLVANLVLGIVVGALAAGAQGQLLLAVLLSFVTGSFGNLWYRKQTAKLIADTASLPPELALDSLRSRGGTSLVGVGVLVALVLVGAVLMVLAAAAQLKQQQEQQNQFVPAPAPDNGLAPPDLGDKPPADDYYEESY